MKYAFMMTGNQGYGYDQVKPMTVRELKEILEDLDDDDKLYLHDTGNSRGANWHSFCLPQWTLEEIWDDENDEDGEDDKFLYLQSEGYDGR